MDRPQAMQLVEELLKTRNMRNHSLAAEAIMRKLAEKLEPGREDDYGIVGLLHDADYEVTEKDEALHTDVVVEKLAGTDVSQEIIDAIKGHCDKAPRTTTMAKAIYACDAFSGLIVAAALVRPDKKLAGLTGESVMKRFNEKSFARGADRDEIRTCEPELGISLPDFAEINLDAMQGISDDLGL